MKTLHRAHTIDKVATSAYMFGRRCKVEKNLAFCKFMEVKNIELIDDSREKGRKCVQSETLLAHLCNFNTKEHD